MRKKLLVAVISALALFALVVTAWRAVQSAKRKANYTRGSDISSVLAMQARICERATNRLPGATEDVLFIRRSPWMVVFDGERAANLILIKDC
jgi:hypothetical protein